ncbi:putative amidase [Quercus suber]|uniref:Amidase n=1 Tax=Quercus suber TaxID=58331 RepID=A0AAW0MB55_QUESU
MKYWNMQNPYLKSGGTCGSSSGSAISVAANMVSVYAFWLFKGSNRSTTSTDSNIGNLFSFVIAGTERYGRDDLIASENTSGIGEQEIEAIENDGKLVKYGFEKLMKDNNLDAMLTIGSNASKY